MRTWGGPSRCNKARLRSPGSMSREREHHRARYAFQAPKKKNRLVLQREARRRDGPRHGERESARWI